MLKLRNFLLLSVFAACLLACNSEKKTTDPHTDSKVSDKAKPSYKPISKDTFDVWKSRWNDSFRNYFATDSLHYFDMPLGDLDAIVGENPVDNARFYMGMNKDTVPHLMLVGTYNGVPNYSIIADYSNACPPHCPN